ncbi:DUF2878 domain-containing protein [Salinimonas lutimaris]|uniref:DUF2878 domain-containing protein n=1 Tax=Salinimonas lutimaris TaxID=914153 RepID=UPI0010C04F04|nr:DUF2878 domain-containing protein [Salinimonas lutimaris]
MNSQTLNKVVNFIWFQTIWFLAIFTQYAYSWLLVGLLAAFFVFSARRGPDLVLMVLVVLLGLVVDSLLTVAGIFVFSSPGFGLPIPLWLLALWAGFSLTLPYSLNYLQGHPVICALLGAIFGPLSYWAGARFGAVSFDQELSITLGLLAVVWAGVFPLCMFIESKTHTSMSSTK